MTLSEIIDLAEADLGLRYQLTRSQILAFINLIQQVALAEDLDVCLVYDQELTILQELTFVSGGYTNAIASDVGKVVTDGSATGTLRYYNNTTRTWAVETSDTFADGGAVTITSGTGAGTLAASDAQAVYRGPYDYPTEPPCRKLMGITRLTDEQLFVPSDIRSLVPALEFDPNATTDYGLRLWGVDDRRMFEQKRDKFFERTITFVRDPDAAANDATNPYRWFYFRRAPVITDEADDDNLIIPEEYHHTLIYQGVEALAKRHLYDEPTAFVAALAPVLKPFYDNVAPLFTRDGDSGTRLSRGQP